MYCAHIPLSSHRIKSHYITHCITLHYFTYLNLSIPQMLHEAAYGEDSPLGGSVYAYNLNKLNTADIQAFRLRLYNGNNLTGETDALSTLYILSKSLLNKNTIAAVN